MEICFVYPLKLGIGGKLPMSACNPRFQFVTGLPYSPKTEAKGVVLVRGLWYEMSDSLGLPFDVNQSVVFLGWFSLAATKVLLGGFCINVSLFL